MQPTTFVAVSHEIDYEPLRIQAQSFNLYADPFIIKQIIVVENFTRGKRLDWRMGLIADFWTRRHLFRSKQDAFAAMQRLKWAGSYNV
jgi:hypothetical protein